jgi:hypothetical protein
MRADPEEIASKDSRRDRFPIVELLLAVVLIAGLLVFWFWTDEKKPVATVVEVPPIAAQPQLAATPDIPQHPATAVVPDAAVVESEGEAVAQVQPASVMLTTEDGDALLRQQLAALGPDSKLNKLADSEHPLDMSAALIDSLGRGLIPRKLLPADPPKQAFSVVQEGETAYMSSASYERYDGFTDTVTALDSGTVVNSFHTLRPLFERAYGQLGLDPDDFDNAIIRTLDLVLATPEIAEPIPLKPKSVVYVYANPELENLPAVQKQLLRMGPDNIRRIKQQARILREALLAQ